MYEARLLLLHVQVPIIAWCWIGACPLHVWINAEVMMHNNTCQIRTVLETKAGPSVRDRQLLVRTRNFLHISLQINVWISQNSDQDRQLFQLSREHWIRIWYSLVNINSFDVFDWTNRANDEWILVVGSATPDYLNQSSPRSMSPNALPRLSESGHTFCPIACMEKCTCGIIF